MMRVAVYHSNKDIRIEEVPVPRIGRGELLVRVESSGICGSDVMEWYRLKKAPLVLGHEITGTVEEIGGGIERYDPGDRVFVSHHVPCNKCRYCSTGHHTLCDTLRTTNFDPGGFAEFVRVPRINVELGTFPLPDGLPFDDGAFIEPLACVVRGLNSARFETGQSALILGSGISGLLFVKTLKALGASLIAATDIEDSRLEAARRFGADTVMKADDATHENLRRANGGRLFDLTVACAGEPRVAVQAVRSTDRGGTVLLFAPVEPGIDVPLPLYDIWRDQIEIVSTYAGAPSDIEEAIGLLETGRVKVDDMITHRLPLEETGRGFSLVADGGESIKVIVKPHVRASGA